MKKIIWVLMALSIGLGGLLLLASNPNESKAAEVVQLKKKKKTKHNYRSLTTASVSGDDTNGDANVLANNWLTYQTFYYRKIPVSGLSLSDPFPLRIERNVTPVSGFEEEHWSGSGYFITEGNVWVNYGYKLAYGGNSTTSFTATGDYRVFAYNGGTRKKATKRKALKVYNFSVSGGADDSDVTGALSHSSNLTYYYRKIAVPGLRVANLGDFRIMQKTPFHQGVSEEYWTLAPGSYLVVDDYIYIPYGSKYGTNSFSILYNPASAIGDYRLYLYSDGKMKKKKLTKQYVKKYTFNVLGGDNTADRISTITSGNLTLNYYYKKVTIPGLRMNDHYNLKVMKKNNFISGFSGDSWSEGSFYTTDNTLWINYATRSGLAGAASTYTDTGAGDYQVFLYK